MHMPPQITPTDACSSTYVNAHTQSQTHRQSHAPKHTLMPVHGPQCSGDENTKEGNRRPRARPFLRDPSLPWPPAHPVLGGWEGAQLGNPIPGGFHTPMQSQQTNDVGWGRGDPGVGGLSARATEAKGPSPGPMLGADESPCPCAPALTDRRPGSGNLPRRCCHGGALWEQERP